jgi:hypothetical protein
MNKSPHFRVHERRPKRKNLKNVNRKQLSYISLIHLHLPTGKKFTFFGTSPDWLKLVFFLVGLTITRLDLTGPLKPVAFQHHFFDTFDWLGL